jgi:tRNA threonylcarbamoyladenosine biosynthesis protein TsaB
VRLLGLDSATENCSAALLIDGDLHGRAARLERGHAQQLLPMVDALLREAGLGLSALDAIAFGRGPGAFTGVRLAASVTQGLAFAAGLPVIPVSDLRALAQRLMDPPDACERVLVCLDARMQEVYAGCFTRGADGLAQPAGAETVSPPAQVRLPADWHGEARGSAGGSQLPFGVGPGFARYAALRQLVRGAPQAELLPRATEIVRLAVPAWTTGQILPPEQALPLYLRDNVTHAPQPKG